MALCLWCCFTFAIAETNSPELERLQKVQKEEAYNALKAEQEKASTEQDMNSAPEITKVEYDEQAQAEAKRIAMQRGRGEPVDLQGMQIVDVIEFSPNDGAGDSRAVHTITVTGSSDYYAYECGFALFELYYGTYYNVTYDDGGSGLVTYDYSYGSQNKSITATLSDSWTYVVAAYESYGDGGASVAAYDNGGNQLASASAAGGWSYSDGFVPSSVAVACDDANACNYGEAADCTYASNGFDCAGGCSGDVYSVSVGGGSYLSETRWQISGVTGIVSPDAEGTVSVCLAAQAANEILTGDIYGDSWNGNVLTVVSSSGTTIFSTSGPASGCESEPESWDSCYDADGNYQTGDACACWLVESFSTLSEVYGCTDPNAQNYNPDATASDGSCTYPGDSCSNPIDGAGSGSIELGGSGWHTVVLGEGLSSATFSTCGAGWDTRLAIHSNCDDGYTNYNDDTYDCTGSYSSASLITLSAPAAGTYLVQVYGWSSGQGDYDLVVTTVEASVCEDADACNTGDLADCAYPDAGYDCDGNWTADYYLITMGGSTDASGTLYDDGGADGNYDVNTDYTFTIDVGDAGTSLLLSFSEVAYESGWDFLYVDCGDGEQSITSAGDVECSGTSASVRQDTDGSVTYAGFAMTWSAVTGVVGCMDSTACDYNADATVEGSCTYPGDSCDCPIDGAGAGATESYGSQWHAVTISDGLSSATFSLCGAEVGFDTKVEVHANCADGYIAYNDDNTNCAEYDDDGNYISSTGLRSEATLNDPVAGTYLVKVYGYSSSFGAYDLAVTESLATFCGDGVCDEDEDCGAAGSDVGCNADCGACLWDETVTITAAGEQGDYDEDGVIDYAVKSTWNALTNFSDCEELSADLTLDICGYWVSSGYTCEELAGYGYDCTAVSDCGLCPVPDACADAGGNSLWSGDGMCDDANNNEACGWDGGDCCCLTCDTTGFDNYDPWDCGNAGEDAIGYTCLDPSIDASAEYACADPAGACADAGGAYLAGCGHWNYGDCIPGGWICDNYDDCGDGQDEVGCGVATCASQGLFSCTAEDDGSECIYNSWVCDGWVGNGSGNYANPDCSTGADEDLTACCDSGDATYVDAGVCGGDSADDGGGDACTETPDSNGNTCEYLLTLGYTCQELMANYNYDCSCSCEDCFDTINGSFDCQDYLDAGYTCDQMAGYGYNNCCSCNDEAFVSGGNTNGAPVPTSLTSNIGDTEAYNGKNENMMLLSKVFGIGMDEYPAKAPEAGGTWTELAQRKIERMSVPKPTVIDFRTGDISHGTPLNSSRYVSYYLVYSYDQETWYGGYTITGNEYTVYGFPQHEETYWMVKAIHSDGSETEWSNIAFAQAGDCGDYQDCDGTCFAEAYLGWATDSGCDGSDAPYGLNFACEAWECDGGACADSCGECEGSGPDFTCWDDSVVCSEDDCPLQCSAGDANDDGSINVTDIVTMVAYILGNTDSIGDCADVNGDGGINVTDIVGTVSIILGGDARTSDATSAEIIKTATSAKLKADGFVGAVQMTLSHGDDFSITLTDDAMVADYKTTDDITTLIIVTPGSEELFTAEGSFEVAEVIVANSSSVIDASVATPEVFGLSSAYPNPFNPTTSVALSLPNDGYVSVTVYNLMGQTVATIADGYMTANVYDFSWNASSVPSGMYFIRAEAGHDVAIQKVMLLK